MTQDRADADREIRARVIDQLVGHLRAGRTAAHAATLIGVSASTILNWTRKDSAFKSRYRDALKDGAESRKAARREASSVGPVCEVAGCDAPTACRRLCSRHYNQWLKTGRKYAEPNPRTHGPARGLTCEVEDCAGAMRSKGLCNKHYKRSRGSVTCPKCKTQKSLSAALCASCFNHRRHERPLEKTCRVCRQCKTLDQFPWRTRPSGRTGPREACRECHKARARLDEAARRAADPDALNERKAAAARRQRQDLRRVERDWLMHSIRTSARTLRLDHVAVLERFAVNGNRCESCGDRCSAAPKQRVQVDHCHSTGEFRGFLCGRCNVIAGQAQDDASRLEAVARYLRQRPPGSLFRVGTATTDGGDPVCAAKRGLTPPGPVRLRAPSIAHVPVQSGPDLFDANESTEPEPNPSVPLIAEPIDSSRLKCWGRPARPKEINDGT